jgi:uncharacterized protein with HEPN domain
MRSERGRRALVDIRDNAALTLSFVSGMAFETFEADRRTLYAVVRCLEIVSEASRRLDPAVMDRHPQIPWRQVADAGNVYRHAYDNVSPRMIWLTVHDRMQEIIAVCDAELGLPS